MQNHDVTPLQPLVRLPSYICVAIVSALNLGVLTVTRAELLTSQLPFFFIQGVVLLAIFVGARRILRRMERPRTSFVRLHYIFEGLFFLHIAWLNLRVLNHLSMMSPFPYADHLLAGWDRALKLDWAAYLDAVISRPFLFEVLDTAYTSLTPLSLIVLILLLSFGYVARARVFIETFFVTAVICIVIGAAFPAKAAVIFLVPDLSIFEPLGQIPGSYHIPYIDLLRAPDGPIILDPTDLPGLATFPSFHTASGVLIIWACRKTHLAAPAWIYSLVMIAATPVHGGHYFIDLVAGTIVALLSVGMVAHFQDRQGAPVQPQPATARMAK